MRVLITGVAGFIGYHLAERCLLKGHNVLGIDNLDPYYDVALKRARLDRLRPPPRFDFVSLNIVESDAFRDAMAAFGPDVVVHLAAQAGVRYSLEAPQAYVASNLSGFLTVLEACRYQPVSQLIYASSSSVYGLCERAPFREDEAADRPVSFYAATKRANELMAHSYAHLFGLHATGLRFFTVYGPWGRPDMMYFKFTRAILRGEPIDVYNNGRMERDFTYIDDVVDGIMPLLERPTGSLPAANGGAASNAPHRVFNVGNSGPVSLARFIEAIEAATGRRAVQNPLPMQSGDVPSTFAAIDHLAAETGFAPRIGIEVGVERFVRWYTQYHSNERKAVGDMAPLDLADA